MENVRLDNEDKDASVTLTKKPSWSANSIYFWLGKYTEFVWLYKKALKWREYIPTLCFSLISTTSPGGWTGVRSDASTPWGWNRTADFVAGSSPTEWRCWECIPHPLRFCYHSGWKENLCVSWATLRMKIKCPSPGSQQSVWALLLLPCVPEEGHEVGLEGTLLSRWGSCAWTWFSGCAVFMW